jgi:hypothetical protein
MSALILINRNVESFAFAEERLFEDCQPTIDGKRMAGKHGNCNGCEIDALNAAVDSYWDKRVAA